MSFPGHITQERVFLTPGKCVNLNLNFISTKAPSILNNKVKQKQIRQRENTIQVDSKQECIQINPPKSLFFKYLYT